MKILVALIMLVLVAAGLISLMPDFIRYMKIRAM